MRSFKKAECSCPRRRPAVKPKTKACTTGSEAHGQLIRNPDKPGLMPTLKYVEAKPDQNMKSAGLLAALILISGILLCGCVQIIVNVPGQPGAAAPAATATPQHTAIPVVTEPVATMAITKETAATDPGFIVPVGDVSRTGYRTYTFNYAPESSGWHEYTIRVPVNMSVYYGARQMNIPLPADSEHPEEIRNYINTFESDPAMEELYSGVLTQLHNARYRNGEYLSDDEYLELIIAFVQQIPYVENPSSKRKYPIEVIYDKGGDSDEKSLLLVNLLAREGYDTSLMVFEDLGYETTGIRVVTEVPDSSLKVFSDGKKSYVFVDAGIPRFIGSVPEVYQTASEPAIYPVGNGTKSYGPINYVWKIVADLKHMNEIGMLPRGTVINTWDKTGTCLWIKNSKRLSNTTCYCCDM